MAYALNVDVIEPDDEIRMSLTFWGRESPEEAELTWKNLRDKFEFFAAAHREGRTIEDLEKIPDNELPDASDEDEY